jgi:thymidylate synthase
MPRPKIFATQAERQAAYIARKEEAYRQGLQAKGLPPMPAIPTLPGEKRWTAAIDQARTLLEQTRDEMQEYFDERSEAWQEGEKGQEMQERIDQLDSLIEELQNTPA